MTRRTHHERSIQRSKRFRSRTTQWLPHKDEVTISRLSEKYVFDRPSSKSDRISQLNDAVGEDCIVRGIVLAVVYSPERALFLKQIALGSVTIEKPSGELVEIDHLNTFLPISVCDKIGYTILKIGNRIQFDSHIRYYNKRKDPATAEFRKFKKLYTDICVEKVQNLKQISYEHYKQPLSLYLQNRIKSWSTIDEERTIVANYVKRLPNRGHREDFVQAVSVRKNGYPFIDYPKMRRYLNKYKSYEMLELLIRRFDFHLQQHPARKV